MIIDQLQGRIDMFENSNRELVKKYEKLDIEYGEIKAKAIVLENDQSSVNQRYNLIRIDLEKKIQELGNKEVKILQ